VQCELGEALERRLMGLLNEMNKEGLLDNVDIQNIRPGDICFDVV
jgi:hypothetical protein